MADCFINKSEPKAKAAAEAPKSEAEAAIIASGKYTVEIPRTWKEVTCYVNDGSCKALSNLDRSAAQFLEYDAFREKTLKQWSSMPDYVVTRVFGGEPTKGEDGKLHKANSPLEENKRMIVFRPNDFPYNLADGLTHDNLWSTQPLPPDMTQKLLELYLPGRELTWWENPTVLQSMPEMWHVQVVSRPESCKLSDA